MTLLARKTWGKKIHEGFAGTVSRCVFFQYLWQTLSLTDWLPSWRLLAGSPLRHGHLLGNASRRGKKDLQPFAVPKTIKRSNSGSSMSRDSPEISLDFDGQRAPRGQNGVWNFWNLVRPIKGCFHLTPPPGRHSSAFHHFVDPRCSLIEMPCRRSLLVVEQDVSSEGCDTVRLAPKVGNKDNAQTGIQWMLNYWAVWFHIHVCSGIVKKLPMIHISHSSRISAFSPDSVFRVQLLGRSWMLRVCLFVFPWPFVLSDSLRHSEVWWITWATKKPS